MQSPFARAGLCLPPADNQRDAPGAADRYAVSQSANTPQSGHPSKSLLSSSMIQMFTQPRASRTESSSSSSSPGEAMPKIVDVTALCSASAPVSGRAPAISHALRPSTCSAASAAVQARSGSLQHSPSPSDLPLSRQKHGSSQQLARWPTGPCDHRPV